MGRGARDAYRRVPRDVSDLPWSVGTNLGEESPESGRWLQFKIRGRGRSDKEDDSYVRPHLSEREG